MSCCLGSCFHSASTMRRLLVRVGCALSLLMLADAAAAEPAVCWVDRVTPIGQDVELHFVPDSGVFARIRQAGKQPAPTDRMFHQLGNRMHRVYPNALQAEAVASRIVLSPGEEAWVSNGLHGACSLALAYQGASLGVMATATVSMGGLPPQVSSQFIPAQ